MLRLGLRHGFSAFRVLAVDVGGDIGHLGARLEDRFELGGFGFRGLGFRGLGFSGLVVGVLAHVS